MPSTPSLAAVAPHLAPLAARLRHLLDQKTKPLGSLGRLEALALRIGCILESEAPVLVQPQLLVCAADHGLTARGVSAYPADVTWQMVENFLAGGAAVAVLARQHGLALTVVDCGVRHDFGAAERPGLLREYRIADGTADASAGPAMTTSQCALALANGRAIVRALPGNVLLLGEMGIGNTSAASMLMSRLTGMPIEACTGSGTGLGHAGVAHKTAVLREALALHMHARSPMDALAALGGFEIATLTGAVLQAADECRVVVVDGFITSVAVLVAARLEPAVLDCCVFAHRSAERAHGELLRLLHAEPLLDLGLRLGEGSGAALAWPLLESACAILRDMASFEQAGVATAAEVGGAPPPAIDSVA